MWNRQADGSVFNTRDWHVFLFQIHKLQKPWQSRCPSDPAVSQKTSSGDTPINYRLHLFRGSGWQSSCDWRHRTNRQTKQVKGAFAVILKANPGSVKNKGNQAVKPGCLLHPCFYVFVKLWGQGGRPYFPRILFSKTAKNYFNSLYLSVTLLKPLKSESVKSNVHLFVINKWLFEFFKLFINKN